MAMDEAPMLKRKGAEATAPWLDGVPVPATKIRRLDAVVPPVEPGAAVVQPVEPAGGGLPKPPPQPLEVEEVPMTSEVAPMLKRKGAEAPEPWLNGVPVPPTKIRRLDAVVPPVEPGAGVLQPPPEPLEVEEVPMTGDVAPVVLVPAANDERAIVVYQPAEAARNLLRGPLRPESPLRVSPDWIRGIKSTVLQEASSHRALFEELASRSENLNLAVVPWAPATATSSSAPATEMMDADQDAEGASMEVEQYGVGQSSTPVGFAMQANAFQHPTQHCWWARCPGCAL